MTRLANVAEIASAMKLDAARVLRQSSNLPIFLPMFATNTSA